MMCTLPFSGDSDEQDLPATIEALQAELESFRGTAYPGQGDQPDQRQEEQPTQPRGDSSGAMIEDTFELDLGTFPLGEGMQLTDQAYLLGPFGQCANDVGNFDNPVGCNAVCQTCGTNLRNFHFNVQFSFEEGLSDRSFGVILRFVDEDNDAMLDYEDYLLSLGFNIATNQFSVYLHTPDRIDPWSVVKSGQAGLLSPGRMNRIEITTSNKGRLMDVFLNQARIVILTADPPQPGETLVTEWADSGAVGFLVLGRGVQARFDNFSFEPLP
jgi:hypothetical protein